MAERHPHCPIDADAPWRLRRGAEVIAEGSGLLSGLRRLWRLTLDEAVDASGNARPPAPMLAVGGLDAHGEVAIALQPSGNSTLLRLRDWIHGARGPLVLEQLAQTHARLLLASARWDRPDPDPALESLTPLTLASLLDEPEALMRALKPGH